MKIFKLLLSITLLTLLSIQATFSQKIIQCTIKTELGDIELDLYPKKAPETVRNFLNYVADGAYAESSFFRVCTAENEADREIKIQVIQGGNIPEALVREPIKIETTKQTGIKHLDGTLSMARGGPNTATSSFFICIGDQPELDFNGKRNSDGYGFAAFGQVKKGMDIVKSIQRLENKGQYLIQPVKILNIKKTEQ